MLQVRLSPGLLIIKTSELVSKTHLFIYNHPMRILKATCLQDLIGGTRFGTPHHLGKLSLKIKDGVLTERSYTQDQKEK